MFCRKLFCSFSELKILLEQLNSLTRERHEKLRFDSSFLSRENYYSFPQRNGKVAYPVPFSSSPVTERFIGLILLMVHWQRSGVIFPLENSRNVASADICTFHRIDARTSFWVIIRGK